MRFKGCSWDGQSDIIILRTNGMGVILLMYSDDLAYIHHKGFTKFIQKSGPAIVNWLGSMELPQGPIVELGCGSGEMLQQLTAAGYDAIGVDVSPGFVEMARRQAPKAEVSLCSWDSYRFPQCAAVLALNEVLSYLPADVGPIPDMQVLFQKVYDALVPTGILIFDMLIAEPDAPMNYQTHRLGEDWAVVVTVSEDLATQRVKREITSFRLIDGHYQRHAETHHLQVLASQQLVEMLERTGFQVSTSLAYGQYQLAPRRLAYFAQKARF